MFGEPIAVDAAAIGELRNQYQFTDQHLRLLERFESLSPRQRAGLLDLLDTRKSR